MLWPTGFAANAASAADRQSDPTTVTTVQNAAAATSGSIGQVSVDLVPAAVLGRRPPSIRGSGAFDLARSRGTVVLHGASGTEKVVFLPHAVFIRQPPPSSGANPLPAGKSWVSAGLNESPGSGSGLPLFVDQVEVVNVGVLLDEIRWGAVTAKAVSGATGGSTPAQEYAVTVDLGRARAEASGPRARDLVRVAGYQIEALGNPNASSAKVRVRVWVAPGGHIVELQWSPPGGGVGTTSISLSDLRSRPHVTAPPPSQTVDVATLSPAGEREGGLGDVA
jgi:hypothetical protein